MDLAKVKVVKVDSVSNAKLAGAVFGIYQDEACRNLIVTMPATDRNGESEAEITKTQDTVYLKEITAPSGYPFCVGGNIFYHDGCLLYRILVSSIFFLLGADNISANLLVTIVFNSYLIFD